MGGVGHWTDNCKSLRYMIQDLQNHQKLNFCQKNGEIFYTLRKMNQQRFPPGRKNSPKRRRTNQARMIGPPCPTQWYSEEECYPEVNMVHATSINHVAAQNIHNMPRIEPVKISYSEPIRRPVAIICPFPTLEKPKPLVITSPHQPLHIITSQAVISKPYPQPIIIPYTIPPPQPLSKEMTHLPHLSFLD
jgi:hypothetical protein